MTSDSAVSFEQIIRRLANFPIPQAQRAAVHEVLCRAITDSANDVFNHDSAITGLLGQQS